MKKMKDGKNRNNKGKCGLCGKTRELCDSHVIPKFIERYQKGLSTKAHLVRLGEGPARIEQSGHKTPLLCAECEQIIQKGEGPFSNNVFSPWENGRSRFDVGPWLFKFVVGLNFRCVVYELRKTYHPVSQKARALFQKAATRWKDYLLNGNLHAVTTGHYLWAYNIRGKWRDRNVSIPASIASIYGALPTVVEEGPWIFSAVIFPGFISLAGIQPSKPLLWEPMRILDSTTTLSVQGCPDPALLAWYEETVREAQEDYDKKQKP